MPFTAYTADRALRLRPGMTLQRRRHTDVDPQVLQQRVDAWFPDGVTDHGERYLLRGGPLHVDPFTELTCELVRRAEFHQAPSRFESIFAWATMPEAQAFASAHQSASAPIFELETDDEPFRADMRCLNARQSILVAAYAAHRYWSQQPNDVVLFSGQAQPPAWELLLRPPVRVVQRVA